MEMHRNATTDGAAAAETDAATGTRPTLVLLLAAALAVVLCNSPLRAGYDALLDVPFSIRLGSLGLEKPVLLWINDGLMAVFFLLVGLELKREFVSGRLADRRSIALPVVAALGGMLAPGAIYWAVNHGDPIALRGAAIPCATDIAFALGILKIAGPGVPASVRVLLTAIAVLDDLGSIVIIAVFYTASLSTAALAVAAAAIVVLAVLNVRGVTRIGPYLVVGAILWVAVLKSGVHATLAGVVLAAFVPLRGPAPDAPSPGLELEHRLLPWVTWLVVPLFAFANSGLHLLDLTSAALLEPVSLGIWLGLVVGKPLGIIGAIFAACRLGLAPRPEGAAGRDLLGLGLLAGIGFTMSLFIGTLAFETAAEARAVRLGVLAASVVAAIGGLVALRRSAAGGGPPALSASAGA